MAPSDDRQVIAVSDAGALAKTAADRLIARIAANPGSVAVALTGGSSPQKLYQLLTTEPYRSRIPWDRVHWFIGDDRFVPADDPLNNMGAARRIFLDRNRPTALIQTMRLAAMSMSCNRSTARMRWIPPGRCSTSC